MISRILATLLLIYLLFYVAFCVMLPNPGDDRTTDAIVVLTGGPGRMERGLDLLKRGRAKRMLVSGVDRNVRPADLAGTYPGSEPLFRCCIDLGHEAVDTRSNAEEVSRWLKQKHLSSVRLVTTDWHMPRARFELARQLGSRVPLLGDAVPSSPSFRQLFMEYNKYLLRRAAVLVGI